MNAQHFDATDPESEVWIRLVRETFNQALLQILVPSSKSVIFMI